MACVNIWERIKWGAPELLEFTGEEFLNENFKIENCKNMSKTIIEVVTSDIFKNKFKLYSKYSQLEKVNPVLSAYEVTMYSNNVNNIGIEIVKYTYADEASIFISVNAFRLTGVEPILLRNFLNVEI